MDNSDPATVKFPKISQVLSSRRDVIQIIWDNFSEIAKGPVLLISGNKATRAFAEVYRSLIREITKIDPEHRVLHKAPDEAEAIGLAAELLAEGFSPTLVVYVGGQAVGDATKVVVRALRDRGKPGTYVTFGAIITSLSNDGIFSVTASVRDNEGLPKSVSAAAPDFVVGHLLTLLRQPYEMKTSCVGDIIAKTSSLWDYNYSCRQVRKYHNDFAADLTTTAYDIGLKEKITREYLHDPEAIDELYRSVQLCGLSMQLTRSSETCSGSEHVGQKWVDEYILRYNKLVADPNKRVPGMTHGQAVIPPTLVTLHLQGQAKRAAAIKVIATRLGLRFKVTELGLTGTVVQAALALGVGFRCPRYLAYSLAGAELPVGDLKERVTILEEVEAKVLPDAIKTAMLDAGVAEEKDFSPLDGTALNAMQRVRRSAHSQMRRAIKDPKACDIVLSELKRLTTSLIPSEDEE